MVGKALSKCERKTKAMTCKNSSITVMCGAWPTYLARRASKTLLEATRIEKTGRASCYGSLNVLSSPEAKPAW